MIAKIISTELIWFFIFIVLFSMIHAWRKNSSFQRVVVFLMSEIVAAIIVSYPLWP
ncbi:hypothetical protein [Acetilactobacillus jinshanensis]|uniref:hypothetical protein n=1 Tax=Acetilactobacillus jinshanensis TaxID=1720083 RepID=UPI0013A64B08|nr:hypothetical protein [Acetilactobacillus jinshanensis]URL61248.1 hypothetical protein HGK75_04435 [uncultured bacterium]